MLMYESEVDIFSKKHYKCCSTTVPECSSVLPVFRIPLFLGVPLVFCVPAFLVLQYAFSFFYIRMFIKKKFV